MYLAQNDDDVQWLPPKCAHGARAVLSLYYPKKIVFSTMKHLESSKSRNKKYTTKNVPKDKRTILWCVSRWRWWNAIMKSTTTTTFLTKFKIEIWEKKAAKKITIFNQTPNQLNIFKMWILNIAQIYTKCARYFKLDFISLIDIIYIHKTTIDCEKNITKTRSQWTKFEQTERK